MATDTDFAQIWERLEGRFDSIESKLDAQSEKLQSIDVRLARVEENTANLQQENSNLREQITKQDNRVWGLLVSGLIALLGVLGKILLFPSK